MGSYPRPAAIENRSLEKMKRSLIRLKQEEQLEDQRVIGILLFNHKQQQSSQNSIIKCTSCAMRCQRLQGLSKFETKWGEILGSNSFKTVPILMTCLEIDEDHHHRVKEVVESSGLVDS